MLPALAINPISATVLLNPSIFHTVGWRGSLIIVELSTRKEVKMAFKYIEKQNTLLVSYTTANLIQLLLAYTACGYYRFKGILLLLFINHILPDITSM